MAHPQLDKCAGYLSRKPDKGLIKKWKQFWFEADAFKLAWSEDKGGAQKGVENLRNVTHFGDDMSKDGEGTFLFELRVGKDVHHLSADSSAERQKWLKYTSQWAPKESNKVSKAALTASAASSPQLTASSGSVAVTSVPNLSPSTTIVEYTQKEISEFPDNVLLLKQVESIDLSENKIAEIPSAIAGISATLTILNLSYNLLASLPPALAQLKKLEELTLHKNKLVVLPDFIGELSSLQALSLGENKLAVLPSSIGKLKQLRRLNVAYNANLILPAELAQCSQIYWLDLTGNKYNSLPQHLLSLSVLEILEASNNNLTSLPLNFVKSLPLLRQLRLSHNRLSSLPDDIGGLAALEEFEVAFNELDTLPRSLGQSKAFLQAEQNPLRALPADVVRQGSNTIKSYLRSA